MSLVVDAGEITGVQDLNVQGRLYDVTFVDGAFNTTYPAGFSGYGPVALQVTRALHAASQGGAFQADPNWRADARPRGCASSQSCTILVPENGVGTAPEARTTLARELIHAQGQVRAVTEKLWPFDASTDTQYMPDMLYAIIEPARSGD